MKTKTQTQTADASQNREQMKQGEAYRLGLRQAKREAQGKPELPEHSPLPWELSHEYCEGFNIAREIAPNCGKLSVIANVQYSDVKYQPTREQAKANAKLIVASVNHAEALAEACEDMMHDLDIFYAKYREPGNKYLANLKARLADFRRAQ